MQPLCKYQYPHVTSHHNFCSPDKFSQLQWDIECYEFFLKKKNNLKYMTCFKKTHMKLIEESDVTYDSIMYGIIS